MKLICIVAKTGRGKDTLARTIERKLNIPVIVSYTTRPMRSDDVDGVSHHFITSDEMKVILEKEDIIAYAKKDSGVEYCASLKGLDDAAVYIVDPEGLEWLRYNYKNPIDLFVVELWAEDEVIEERLVARGDDWDTYLVRKRNEEKEFNYFHSSGQYNVSIDACMSREEVYSEFLKYYERWSATQCV